MIASNDISRRSDEIQILVASNSIPTALKKLMDFVRDFATEFLNEAIVISANFVKVEGDIRTKAIDYKEYTKGRNELLFQMLTLIDEVKNSIVVRESLIAIEQ